MQIANCKMQIDGSKKRRSCGGAALPVNLQFSFCNLQFAIAVGA
jgi:hypothetical protein